MKVNYNVTAMLWRLSI